VLVGLKDREGIDPVFRGDVADRRQRVAFLESAVEDHVDATVAKLAIDRLTIVPLTIHSVLPKAGLHGVHRTGLLDCCTSYSDVVNYNTIARARFFLNFFSAPVFLARNFK
jgi:hypothetical protein